MMTADKKGRGDRKEKGRVGVYICHCGGNISDHVDVEQVRQRMGKLPEH